MKLFREAEYDLVVECLDRSQGHFNREQRVNARIVLEKMKELTVWDPVTEPPTYHRRRDLDAL